MKTAKATTPRRPCGAYLANGRPVRGMALSGVGIALGAVLAAVSARLMSSLLFGIAPIDASTFVAAAGVLAAAALLATYVPAAARRPSTR